MQKKTFIYRGKDTGVEIEQFSSWNEAVKKLGERKALSILNSGWAQRQRTLLHSRLATIQGTRPKSPTVAKTPPTKQEIRVRQEMDAKLANVLDVLVKE